MKVGWVWTLALVLVAVAPATAIPQAAPPAGTDDPLRRLGIEVQGEDRKVAAVELTGLRTISEAELWERVGRPQPPLEFAQVAALITALEATQAFSRLEPRLRLGTDITVEIRLHEHAQLRSVVVQGLTEVPEAEVIADLLGRESDSARWLARLEAGAVRPGILQGGIEAAVRRVLQGLFDAGYRMADASGTLSPDGVLTLVVDEGRIGEVRLVGPALSLTRTVEEKLDLPRGRTFLAADVAEAVKRVERELPFLRPDRSPRRIRALPRVALSPEPSGAVRFALQEAPPEQGPELFEIDGRTLTVFFKPSRTLKVRVSPDELLRHTPVGGIAVGIRSEARLWDARNRVHLRLESYAGAINEETRQRVEEDGDYQFGLRLRVPALRIADLGLESHGFVDSADRWRTNRHSAYLNSLFFDRPDSEYYWRLGSGLNLTLQPLPRLLVGVEQRGDRYRTLPSLENRQTVLSPDPRFENPPIEEGKMGSLLLRAEIFSEAVSPEQIQGLFRTPETSIVALPRTWGLRTGYQVLATLELGRPGLERDSTFRFTRLVSDNMAFLATGPESGLRLRLRVAGGSGLPLQKQEALGGWSALRGYGFKELRGGDWSALGMVEYRHDWLSGFADLGSLHRPGEGWTGPHLGAGAKVHLNSAPLLARWIKNQRLVPPLQLAVAWRVDAQAKVRPEVRLLVGHLF